MKFVLLTLAVACAYTCPKYSCHAGGFDLGTTCAYQTSTGDVSMQICDLTTLGDYCNVNPLITKNFTCGDRPPRAQDEFLPGQSCISGRQCQSGNCLNNKCQGLPLGSFCISHADCNVGYYCGQSGKCLPQMSQFQSCNSDWDCQNQFACNRTLFTKGTCLPYYSLPNGSAVGMCVSSFSEGMSNLCASGSCSQIQQGHNGEGICQAPFKSDKPYPLVCNEDADCTGHNSAGTLGLGSCSCGMDKNGAAYCNAYSGDQPAVIARELLIQHTSSAAIANCHTLIRFDQYCYRQTLPSYDVFNLTQSLLLAGNTPRYQNNDFCTQTIYNFDYWRVSASDFTCKAYGCKTNLS